MMRVVFLALALLSLPLSADAAAAINLSVECSTIKLEGDATFDACGTSAFTTPPVGPEGDIPGDSDFSYTITSGLKEGTDTTALSEADRTKAFSNGIQVDIKLRADETCRVTVGIKEKSTVCKLCKFCGNGKFTTDCTNVPNGRSTKCEKAFFDEIYFPLTKAALQTGPTPPVAAPVKAPVSAPLKAAPVPVRAPKNWWTPTAVKAPAPVKAPVKAPAKAPVPTPKAPVKAPAKAPVKAPARTPIRWVVPAPTKK